MNKRRVCLWVSMLIIFLAACSSESDPGAEGPTGGEAKRGEALFAKTADFLTPNCETCHATEAGVEKIGSSAYLWAQTSAEVIADPAYTGEATTVEAYLRESILNPNIYISEGYQAGIMYAKYNEKLSEQDIADLVAYIISLQKTK